MVTIDTATLGATTYKEIKEARKEQQDWHQAGTKVALSIKDGVDQICQGQENQQTQQERRVILDWLTPINYASQQSDFVAKREEGTGQWLLNSHKFQEWLTTNMQTLFCLGMLGASKTMIASIVVDHLCTRFQSDACVGIAYIYCNFRRQYEQKPADLLASLLKQLVQEQSSVPESVKSLYQRHESKRTRPSFGEISKVLHSVVAEYSRMFIIIDALDECQVLNGGRRQFLSEIFSLQTKTRANLFTTSRFIPEITNDFQGSISLEIRASDQDMQEISGRSYIATTVIRLTKS